MSTTLFTRRRNIWHRAPFAVLACATLSFGVFAQSPAAFLTVLPSVPSAYEPFVVRVNFSTPVCFNLNSPVYSSVSFTGGVLSLSLSHLKPGPCVTERLLRVSGLPDGNHTVRVSVTSARPSTAGDAFPGGSTVDTPIAQIALTVSARSQLLPMNVYTARVDGDSVFRPFAATEGGGGPVVVWTNHGDPVTGGGDWLDVGSPLTSGYSFKAWRPVPSSSGPAADAIPAPYEPIYFFRYPTPLQGVFAATSAECLALTRSWLSPSATACPGPSSYVLQYRNGACPLGATQVYRLFHPASVAHRYTQSADTYSELQNFGFIGEGPVFCAPARG